MTANTSRAMPMPYNPDEPQREYTAEEKVEGLKQYYKTANSEDARLRTLELKFSRLLDGLERLAQGDAQGAQFHLAEMQRAESAMREREHLLFLLDHPSYYMPHEEPTNGEG